MPLTITYTGGHSFPAGVPVTLAAFRKAPSISISGSVATGDIAAGAITPAKTSPGAYFYALGTYDNASAVYNVTLDPALTALTDGAEVTFKASALNASVPTHANVNGLGQRKLYKHGGATLEAGDIRANQVVTFKYNSSLDSGTGGWEMKSHPALRVGEYVATDSGAANAYAIAPTPGFTDWAHAAGKLILFKAANANTGASTLNINGLGVKSIKKFGDKPLGVADIRAGMICYCAYDGVNVQLLNPAQGNAIGARVKFDAADVVDKTINNTVDAATDRLTVNAHGITAATNLDNVQGVFVFNNGGTLPTGLAENQIYYAFVVDANTLSLHTSRQGGLDGTTDRVDITANGTGTNTLSYLPLKSKYNVGGVTQRTGAGARSAGRFHVWFLNAFTSGNEVVVAGTARHATAASVANVKVDPSDAAAADRKMVRIIDAAGTDITNADLDEVNLIFAGDWA